ncbi:MAG: hypothetical protein LBE36_01685 [Flavobacteriaceae bacterium]|jgi:hypothetical protein|nr:hypothetical protein [Flavobacteriaceae bacterium]
MRKLLILKGIFLLLISCTSQNKLSNSLSCDTRITVQYDNAKRKAGMAKTDKKSITVIFVSDFNDHIKSYVNGKEVLNDFVKTNDTGLSNNFFYYNYSQDENPPIIKIQKENSDCFDIKINKKYKLVYIFHDSNLGWIVRFTNKYLVLE